ncbi:MAG: hypothetical protein U0411_13690 [Thermodesulfovibrionales bacterium]
MSRLSSRVRSEKGRRKQRKARRETSRRELFLPMVFRAAPSSLD